MHTKSSLRTDSTMKLLLLVILTATQCILTSTGRVNKCCPENQGINSNGKCEEREGNFTGNDFYWFPLDQQTYLKNSMTPLDSAKPWLSKFATIQLGFTLDCSEPDIFSFDGEIVRTFRILIDEEYNRMSVAVNVSLVGSNDEFYRNLVLPTTKMCFDLNVGNTTSHLFMYCRRATYVPKFCPLQQYFDFSKLQCVPNHGADWTPESGDEEQFFPMLTFMRGCSRINFLEPDSFCDNLVEAYPRYKFFPNGSAWIRHRLLPNGNFSGESVYYSPVEFIRYNLLYCWREEYDEPETDAAIAAKLIAQIEMIMSCILALATLVIFCVLKELRSQIHGKMALLHLANLALADVLWTIYLVNKNLSRKHLFINTVSMQFFYLSSFTWLNVMCFDEKQKKATNIRSSRTIEKFALKVELRKISLWSLYGWGIPGLFLIYVVAMNFSKTKFLGLPRPWNICGTMDDMILSQKYYYYSPIGVSLLIDVGFYAYILWKLFKIRRQTAILRKGGSTSSGGIAQTHKQRLIIFTKLFLLMGVSSIIEISLWIHEYQNPIAEIFGDALHLLRAIWLFALYICKRSVWMKIKEGVRANLKCCRLETVMRKFNRENVEMH